MDLLKLAPKATAKYVFRHPADNSIVTTDKGDEMFAEVYGADSKEYKLANLEMLRAQLKVNQDRVDESGEGAEFTDEDREKMKAATAKFMSDITVSIKYQVGKRASSDKEAFYGNADLAFFHGKIEEFAKKTTNFLDA